LFSLLGVVSKTASLFDIRDERTQFVPLSRVLDTELGGTIQGPLEVQANLYATGKTEQDSTGKESFVDSRISIGVQRSGDTLRVEPNQAQLEIRSNGQSNFVKLFDTQGINDYLVVTSEGNVRITGEALVTQETNLATTSGKVTIGDSQRTDETLLVQGNSTFKGDADITRTANLATTSGKVTIGDSQRTDETLLVQGNSTFKGNAEVSGSTTLAIAPSTIVQIGELPDGESIPDNTKIQVIGNSVFAGQLTSNQLLLTTGILQSPETTDLQLQVNNTAYLTAHHTGHVSIGNTLVTPTSQLGISGNAAIGANYLTAETSALPPNGLIVEGTVGIGKPNPDSNFSLDIEGDIRGTGKTILGLANGATVQVGEGNIPGDPGEFQFYVNGSMNISQKATITETLHLHRGILNSSGVNSLAFQIGETPYLTIDASRTSAAGSDGADRTAQVRVSGELDVGSVIRGDRLVARNGKIASRNGTDLALQIGTTDHLTIDQTGNIGIGNRPRQNRKLFVDGALECDSLTLNSGLSLDQAVTVQSLTTTSGNIDTENNQDLALKVGGKQGITLDRNNNNIDVIIEDGAIKSRDSQPLTLLAGDQTKVELTNRDIVLQSDNQTKINISPRRIELQSDNDTAITVEPNQLKLDPGNRTGMTLKSDGDIILAENRGQVMIGTERIRVSENVDSTNIKLYVDGKIFGQEVNGRNIKQLSSATFKADISDLAIAESLEILRQLAPVKFKYRGDETNHIHAGFIAENTPDLLTSDNKKSVKLLDIVAVLTKALQQQDEEIAQLNKTVQTQREDIDYLAEKIRAIEMKGRSPWRRGARFPAGSNSLMSSTTHSPQKESPMQRILRAIRHLIRL
jgi:hypothetical protein